MRAALPTLGRVTDMRLVRERQHVAEALAVLREATRQREVAADRLAAAEAEAERAGKDFRAKPQCEQRRLMLDYRAGCVEEARSALTLAEDECVYAQEGVREARQRELRAENKRDLVRTRIATLKRQADELAAEREGEERWIAPQIA